jgi:hypothetical protein
MEQDEMKLTKKWVDAWKRAAPELERIRRNELREVSTSQAIQNLSDAFDSCLLHFKPLPTSGLVEQQAWFRRLHK